MNPYGRRLMVAGFLAISCLLVLAPPTAAQCSMCQQVVAQSPEGRRIAAELNRAILLMFIAPYLIFTSFVLVLFRAPIGREVRRVVRLFFLPR